MLVLLTGSILARLDNEEQAAEVAAQMTQASEKALEDVPPGRAEVLGYMVSIIPSEMAT